MTEEKHKTNDEREIKFWESRSFMAVLKNPLNGTWFAWSEMKGNDNYDDTYLMPLNPAQAGEYFEWLVQDSERMRVGARDCLEEVRGLIQAEAQRKVKHE